MTKSSPLLDTRVIYCGDNLDQLRKLPEKCVDLIYIDPPFNSNRNYEVFWGEKEVRQWQENKRKVYPPWREPTRYKATEGAWPVSDQEFQRIGQLAKAELERFKAAQLIRSRLTKLAQRCHRKSTAYLAKSLNKITGRLERPLWSVP